MSGEYNQSDLPVARDGRYEPVAAEARGSEYTVDLCPMHNVGHEWRSCAGDLRSLHEHSSAGPSDAKTIRCHAAGWGACGAPAGASQPGRPSCPTPRARRGAPPHSGRVLQTRAGATWHGRCNGLSRAPTNRRSSNRGERDGQAASCTQRSAVCDRAGGGGGSRGGKPNPRVGRDAGRSRHPSRRARVAGGSPMPLHIRWTRTTWSKRGLDSSSSYIRWPGALVPRQHHAAGRTGLLLRLRVLSAIV